MKQFLALRTVVAIVTVAAIPRIAAAQSSTSGDIAGTVRDAGGTPVANATVVADGPQGARAGVTDSRGAYLIEFLTPGLYDVTATAQGFQPVTQRGVQVRLGTRITLNLALAPMAETEETLTITAAAPTVDTTTTSVNTNIGSDLIGTVPTTRTFTGLLTLAPGVSDPGDPVLGAQGNNPSISGATGLENTYIVNGVNITNQGYGSLGSYSRNYGSLGSGVNFDFIEAVQIKSGGFEAEYGESLGGVINVITKRGTNEFHGSVFFNTEPEGLQSNRRRFNLRESEWAAGEIEGEVTNDVGVTLGGPLVKDKAFFFAAFSPQQEALIRRAPGFDLAALGRETTRRSRNAYAGTLTWNVVDNHALELSLFGDPSASEFGPQSGRDLLVDSQARYSSLRFGGNTQAVRYNGVFGSWMSTEATVAHTKTYYEQELGPEGNQYQFDDFRGDEVVIGGGLGAYQQKVDGETFQYDLKLTNYANLVGRHEIKYGVSFQDVSFASLDQRTGPVGGTFFDENGDLQTYTTGLTYEIHTADDGSTVYRVVRGNTSNPNIKAETRYTAFFLQDRWQPIQTVTLDIGARIEEQRLVGGGPGAIPYTFKYLDNFQPRLGASWDFTNNGRGKVFMHVGRFVEKIPLQMAIRGLSTETGVTLVDYSAPTFQAEDQITDPSVTVDGDSTHLLTQGAFPTRLAPGTKSQYQDELVLGVEYEPVETINVGLRYIHRELGRILEDWNQSPLGPDGVAGTADDETVAIADLDDADDYQNNMGYVIGNPGEDNMKCPPAFPNCVADPRRVYDALELTVEKRLTTNWQVLASYRLARLFGNYEGNFQNDNGQDDVNITSAFDFANNTPVMEKQGIGGPLPTDRTHVVKLAGSYSTPGGMTLGAFYQFWSGTPRTLLAAHPIYQNSGEVPVNGRGKDGRNPNLHQLDLRAEYRLPLRRSMDLRASVAVFNVLDSQEVMAIDQYTEFAPGESNPEVGRAIRYQRPRTVRLGLRATF